MTEGATTPPLPPPPPGGTEIVGTTETTQNEPVIPVEATYNVNTECFKTMEELRLKHREFYDEMVKHLAVTIMNEIKKMPEKLKRARRSAGG